MEFKLILVVSFLILSVVASKSNCGGNCPSGDCQSCPCGNQKKYPDIQQVCGGIGWDVNCCKCIVLRSSYGNAHNMQPTKKSAYSSVAIGIAGLIKQNCGLAQQIEDLCQWSISKACMVDLWDQYQDWRYFSKQAKACGCEYGLEQDNENINEHKLKVN